MIDQYRSALDALPLVAILRGIRPDEVAAIGDELVSAGFRLIEVPLNSPQPFDSIEILARRIGSTAIVGAGTVLQADDVRRVRDAGGKLVVSPNVDIDVIAATAENGMISLPGYFTMTEAFRALNAGAHGLKLFPAEAATPAVLRAQRAVLPATVPALVVGGVSPENMGIWKEAGASGFGIGSSLYRPGLTAAEVGIRARQFAAAWSDLP